MTDKRLGGRSRDQLDRSRLPASVSTSPPPVDSLIPGLPDQVSRLCLLKVPRVYHSCLISVCSSWRQLVRCRDFYQDRRSYGFADAWLVLVSTDTMVSTALTYTAYDLGGKQLLFKASLPKQLRGGRRDGAERPGSEAGAAAGGRLGNSGGGVCFGGLEYYRVAARDEYVAVVGKSGETNFMAVCDTVRNEWRLGGEMEVWRRRFGCGVMNGKLYVAGGVNGQGQVEGSTEVYDFGEGRWARAGARLPAGMGEAIEGDAVFEGKLYLRCAGSTPGGSGSYRAVFWVYDAEADEWAEAGGLGCGAEALRPGGLVSSESCMYALSLDAELHRWEPAFAEWTPAGCAAPASSPPLLAPFSSTSAFSPSPCPLPGLAAPSGPAPHPSSGQRAFAYRDELYILDSACPRRPTSFASCCNGLVKCHPLFVDRPWFRAGAIVRT